MLKFSTFRGTQQPFVGTIQAKKKSWINPISELLTTRLFLVESTLVAVCSVVYVWKPVDSPPSS
ncbi:MAG: hypothetical protein CBC63_07175 [Euryarchaeota archaeon TMED103]|nr:MAG: hypothetical protein CBC63_07175 [Euryarchaeota archaeon TMED103]